MSLRTEDQVRDYAKLVLGFDEAEENVDQGTGQITTFNQLGFKGYSDKPDGWYLPKNMNDVAIILETKSEERDISKQIFIDELMKNIDIISSKYKKTVGILYNGKEIAIYKNKELIRVANKLQHKQYYIDLFKENYIDKNKIFTLTKRINDLLHFKFGIKNLYHRMIFTASALVVERFGGNLEAIKDNGYEPFRNKIYDTLAKSLQDHRKQNLKIDILLEVYSEIKMNIVENQDDINTFIDCIIEIAESINSDNWNGEDVMGIFFNEFNRYKKKSESGQVFTPEHITSFMYDLLEITYNDRLLDATCGKSTILNLIAKYYEPTGGEIRIGGKPISHISAERVLEQISMVDQDVFLFDDTIRENIRHARPNATDEEIEAACREANCDGFIRKMEKGYDTPTGENGNLLSGGERQRISIARAILKNSPILLLDEATASLDIENELAVKQAIANLLKEKKTVVMIAHTLSIVKNADQILVVSGGKIAEAGTHDELLAKGGKYAAMWNAEQKLSA